MNEPISVFCAFTREWLVDRWIADFEHSVAFANKSIIHLNLIVDCDSMEIATKLRGMESRYEWGSFQIEMNRDHNPNEVNIGVRRQRIAVVKNQSKGMIARNNSAWTLSLEDDSAFAHLDCFCRLREGFNQHDTVGMVSGVEAGRWNMKYIGAWRFDNVDDPQTAYTVKQGSDGFEEIDAAGFYAYLTPTHLYLAFDYYWHKHQPWGPDVNYGLWLRQQGYKCLIDWQTPIDHNDHNKLIKVFDKEQSPIYSVCYNKNKGEDTWYRDDDSSPANR